MNDDTTPAAIRDQEAVGRALRTLREGAGLTQKQLAERVGVDPAVVGRIERGRRGVRWHTVMRFLRALGASLRDLAGVIEDDDTPRPGKR
jgi:transcriptional regulator with XRE-family HTH domain